MPKDEGEHSMTSWLRACDKLKQLAQEGELRLVEDITMDRLHQGLLDQGGVVTVIGARESNAPEFWNDPRCVFLTGPEAVRRGLPAHAKAVIFTRFLGHTAFHTIRDEAKDRGLLTFPVQGTGHLKRTLASILAPKPSSLFNPPVLRPTNGRPAYRAPAAVGATVADRDAERDRAMASPLPIDDIPDPAPPDEPPAPAPPDPTPDEDTMTPKTVPPPRGEVTAWVRQHYTPTLRFADMLRLAEHAKVPYKEASISAAFYAVKRGVPPRNGAAAAPLVAQTPVTNGNGSELVRLIDDAIAGLHLVREAALKASVDQERMAQILKLASQLGS
jgi:hypothetical protein